MMTWEELTKVIQKKGQDDKNFLSESVKVYDSSQGEFYPADVLEFCESDYIIDADTMFIEIKSSDGT